MAPREDVRHALIRRVTGKVSGHGITRRSVEGAVDRVLAAIPGDPSAPVPATPRIAVLSAASAPDLPSRARRALERHGATVIAMGVGTSGRHTVVTVQLAGGAGEALARAAAELGASVSVLDAADGRRLEA